MRYKELSYMNVIWKFLFKFHKCWKKLIMMFSVGPNKTRSKIEKIKRDLRCNRNFIFGSIKMSSESDVLNKTAVLCRVWNGAGPITSYLRMVLALPPTHPWQQLFLTHLSITMNILKVFWNLLLFRLLTSTKPKATVSPNSILSL